MAITSELIGKLGGGTEIKSVDFSVPGKSSTNTHINTITLRGALTSLLVVMGEFTKGVRDYDDVYIEIGGVKLGKPITGEKNLSVAKILTNTEGELKVDVILVNKRYQDFPLSGTLYLVDFPN